MKHDVKRSKYGNSEMLTFYNDVFRNIRVATFGDTVWFVAGDVAEILNYANGNRDVKKQTEPDQRIDTDETEIELDTRWGTLKYPIPDIDHAVVDGIIQFPYIFDKLNRVQRPVWITEEGVNSLIMCRENARNVYLYGDKSGPTVYDLKNWVNNTILPTVRRYGKFDIALERTAPSLYDDLLNNGFDDDAEKVAMYLKYEINRAIDSDGFVRMIPIPDGEYDMYIKRKYHRMGYFDGRESVKLSR